MSYTPGEHLSYNNNHVPLINMKSLLIIAMMVSALLDNYYSKFETCHRGVFLILIQQKGQTRVFQLITWFTSVNRKEWSPKLGQKVETTYISLSQIMSAT